MIRSAETDIGSPAHITQLPTPANKSHPSPPQLPTTDWFTRGFTLQELLAPSKVSFYNKDLTFVGSRSKCAVQIEALTGISKDYLTGHKPLKDACIAQKMSWASKRQTTRYEDHVYCLLGIFDVNMALLYGEGVQKAFRRLQEHILANSTDDSIFAWWITTDRPNGGLLAETPSDCAQSSEVVRNNGRPSINPYQMTSKGVQLDVFLAVYMNVSIGLLHLTCEVQDSSGAVLPVMIELDFIEHRTIDSLWREDEQFIRKTYNVLPHSRVGSYERSRFSACMIRNGLFQTERRIWVNDNTTRADVSDMTTQTVIKTILMILISGKELYHSFWMLALAR